MQISPKLYMQDCTLSVSDLVKRYGTRLKKVHAICLLGHSQTHIAQDFVLTMDGE